MNDAPKKLPLGSIALAILLTVTLVACGAPRPSSGPTATPTVAPPSAATGLQADLDAMLDARDTIHPDGWHGLARTDWVAAAGALAARAADLSPDERLTEMVRLAAMPSWNGRDGHTGIFPFTPADGTLLYPLRWWEFSDGLVITAARPPYEDLVGSRVEAIAGRPIAEVLRLVEPLAPRDNPSNLRAFGPLYLRVSNLLAGLGVIDAAGPTTFTLVDRNGSRRDVEIDPTVPVIDDDWDSGLPHRLAPTDAPWLRDQDTTLWWTFLEDSGTLFAQFNHVRGDASSVVSELRERAKQDDVRRVVIDLRHNSGGDNTTLSPLELALRDPMMNREGRLFAIIGRVTFSAAANFATDLEGSTSVIFAGEPMGGSPNLYGDTRPVDLASTGQTLYMATRYWQRSTPDDERLTIEPDISVDLSSEDYFAGRDPVLEAILAQPAPSD